MRMIARIVFIITNLAAVGAIAEALGRGFGSVVLAMILTVPLSILAISSHELGHAWMVRRLGGRLESLTVLGVDFVGTWQPSSSRPSTGHEIGGHVTYAFDGGETRHEHALIAVAGPAANFLLALAAALLAALIAFWAFEAVPPTIVTTDFQPSAGGAELGLPSDAELQELVRQHRRRPTGLGANEFSVASRFLGALAVLSAGVGLANLVPFKGSDGAAIFDAMRPSLRR